jgi:hypothetical protein
MVIETRDNGQVFISGEYFGYAGYVIDHERVRHFAFSPDALFQSGQSPSVAVYVDMDHWDEVIGQLWTLAQMAISGEDALRERADTDLLPGS